MTDPALAAEAARIERLLYSRLEPDERARLEAEYAALVEPVVEPVETDSVALRLASTGSTTEVPSRRPFLVIGAVAVSLLVGGIAGWVLAPRVEKHVTSGILTALSRPQVITADDASDIPPVNLGSAYEASTFRHLKVLTAPGVGQEPVGNVYGVIRASDRAVCLVVVSRSEFVAGSCAAPAEVPAAGLALSVNIRAVEFSMIWRPDGTVTAKSDAI